MATPQQRPSLGRIVHFVDNYLTTPCAAIITSEPRMQGGLEVVDLTVLRPGFSDVYPVPNAPMGEPGKVGHWWWPSRLPPAKEEAA